MSDLKARLLKPRLPEATIDLAGVGTVRVRGLSRSEVQAWADADLDAVERERKVVAACMVDPPMTEDDVAAWREGSVSDEIETVTKQILVLSGLDEGAPKSGVPGVRDEPGAGAGVLPGGAPGDDGDAAPRGDA